MSLLSPVAAATTVIQGGIAKSGNNAATRGNLRFDGRPYEYRNPYNVTDRRSRSGDYEPNPNSYEWMDPLYSYSRGRVSDAAFNLGITNINSPDEVNRILSEMRQPSGSGSAANSYIPKFIQDYVGSGSTTHVGKDAVLKAQAAGMSLDDIVKASQTQGFTIASGAQEYIDQENAVPNFIKRYVDSGSTTHVGLAAVKRAEAEGKTLQDIRNASRNQGFTLAEGANKYIDQQLSNTTATALPDFFSNYVNSGSTTHAGKAAVERAVAAGMSIDDIQKASLAQNFQFATGAQDYLNQARGAAQKKDYDDQVAALAKQQESYLNDLRIEQDNRLNTMASEQTRRANDLALGQRTYQQNQTRARQLGALQIGGGSQTPRTGGTQGFKRRKLQINPATSNALSGILGGTAGTKTTNTLNV